MDSLIDEKKKKPHLKYSIHNAYPMHCCCVKNKSGVLNAVVGGKREPEWQ